MLPAIPRAELIVREDRAEREDTRQRLIDAATQLLIERGFDFASVREITSLAGLNIASVNYHYGSKDQLLDAVMLRNLERLANQRYQRLAELEASATDEQPIRLDDLLDTWFDPTIELLSSDGHSIALIERIAQYLLFDRQIAPSAKVEAVVRKLLTTFCDAICAIEPIEDRSHLKAVLLRASQLLILSDAQRGHRSTLPTEVESTLQTPWPLIKENLKSFVKAAIASQQSLQ